MAIVFLCLVLMLFLALHVFGVIRAVTVCRDIRDDLLVARNEFTGIIGFLGIALLVTAILTVWLVIAGCSWILISRTSEDLGPVVFVLFLALFGFPLAHAVAEFLIHVGLDDASTAEALHREYSPREDRNAVADDGVANGEQTENERFRIWLTTQEPPMTIDHLSASDREEMLKAFRWLRHSNRT